MKSRNILLFVVLSTLLLGGYNAYVSYRRSIDGNFVLDENKNFTKISDTLGVKQTKTTNSDIDMMLPNDSVQYSLQTELFKIIWNKNNGAILQVIWNDGTKFFPENDTNSKDNNAINYDQFAGIGVALNVKFDRNPEIIINNDKHIIIFANNFGDSLTYTIPHKERIIDVELKSTNNVNLNLIPKPNSLSSVQGLGRVFTLSSGQIKSETWPAVLKDPFLSFLGLKRKNLPSATCWLGMDAGIDTHKANRNSHYFAVLWESYVEPKLDIDMSSGYIIPVDNTGKVKARLYLGPKHAKSLVLFNSKESLSRGIDFTQVVDFGFFGLVAKFLFMILYAIHSVVHNWGLAIILLAVVIRCALWPLNSRTIVQMLRAKELEPFQKVLQAKYAKFGNDMAKKAEMQKELMAFYKRNKHNPMGGCLPSLLQMPVFFALWSMLNAVFELRHAPFIGWLVDLSASDPYYIIPILMGISMIIQQMVSPTVGDQTQRKIMMFLMPIMFSFFFANTPSGLCIYYLTFNIIGIIQTWLVIKSYKSQPIVE